MKELLATVWNEQRLLAEFRKLSSAGQQELLDYAAFLVKKSGHQQDNTTAASSKNQCSLKQAVERPEAAAEPIFTE